MSNADDLERLSFEEDMKAYLEMENSKLISREEFEIMNKDLDIYEENKKA